MWALYARAVASTLLLVLAGLGAGRWIHRLLPAGLSILDSLACECLGGLGLLSTTLFLIGQVAFTRAVIFSLVFASALLGLHHLLTISKTSRASFTSVLQATLPCALTIAIVLMITALAGFAEITGDWGHDGVAYHLHGPKVWLREGIVRPVPDTSNSAFPATNEILFGALMAIGGERAPGFSAVLTLGLFFLIVRSLALRIGLDPKNASWAVALVATMPAVYTGAHSGFVDVFYATLILTAARVGFDARLPVHFLGFGIFCGLAMATKYSGLVALPLLLLCGGLSTRAFDKSAWKATFLNAAICITGACLLASPYYVRNWILFGFPIFPPPPFASRLIRPGYFPPEALSGYYALFYKHGAGLGRGLGAFLLLPYNLTYHTSNFNGAGGIGLGGLALGPLGLYVTRRDWFARALALFGTLLTIFWFFTLQESRYLIPVYPICAIFGVLGWRYARATGRQASRVLSALVIICSLLYGLFMIGSSRANDLRAVFSPSFAKKHREESIPFLASFEYLNNEPAVRKVLILDPSVPPYYLDKSYVKPFGQWGEIAIPGARSTTQVLERLGELHVSHVLDVESEVSTFRVPPGSPGLSLVFEKPRERVYRVD
jgi:hypothetical protein